MKALSLTQPWATLVVLGIKHWETRSWFPSVTPMYPFAVSRFAIHASKKLNMDDRQFAHELMVEGILPGDEAWLPLGAVLGEVTLIGLVRTETALRQGYISDLEQRLGNYDEGRYAWELADAVAYPEPIPARGMLGLWEWNKP